MDNKIRNIYCDECNHEIPVEELEDGTILIHCPKCTGECLVCDCHLVSKCFSDSDKVKLIHKDEKTEE